MCRRYYIADDETSAEIRRICSEITERERCADKRPGR